MAKFSYEIKQVQSGRNDTVCVLCVHMYIGFSTLLGGGGGVRYPTKCPNFYCSCVLNETSL